MEIYKYSRIEIEKKVDRDNEIERPVQLQVSLQGRKEKNRQNCREKKSLQHLYQLAIQLGEQQPKAPMDPFAAIYVTVALCLRHIRWVGLIFSRSCDGTTEKIFYPPNLYKMIRSPSLGCVMLLRRCDGGFI
ncbi:hypothetical protein OUZ56_002871 [Daphnia magna]|uniref:Uncharacterized protein n=1 Tax=Daphnia magna TaxID=35525 RepID=A0ABR0A713_9CRUS|nr:hypothetical protein OUZ56_002871 [Daphnia magna]